MAFRYRLDPTQDEEETMREWCAHARYVWNIALEQRNFWRRGMRPLSGYDQKKELKEARKASEWLASGPSVVQQQAILDLDQAFRNWWRGSHGRPTWRKTGQHEGFVIREAKTRRLSRRWAAVLVPKCGWVRFRLHRPLGEHGMARVTLDRSGRWHVSFSAVPPMIKGPGTGEIIGIDRGIVVDFQSSDGRRWDVPGLRPGESRRLRLLQRKMSRQEKGSARRERTRRQIATVKAREADRRKDVIEKATTELARTADVVRIEDLRVKSMMRSAKGTVEKPGRNVAQKRGLNHSIAATGWSMFAIRLRHKIGDRLERVPAAYTSQCCSGCGHTVPENRESQAVFRCRACGFASNADINAALNIAAGYAVSGRGGTGAIGPPDEASTILVGVA